MNRMFLTWHTHMFDRPVQVGAIIQTFLVVNIQIFQVVKNSNISRCQKLKYFWLSNIQIFLVVKNSNISGCQNWKDNLHISSFFSSPTTVRETTSSRVCPLFLVVLQWSLNGPRRSFVLHRIYDLPFNIIISCHQKKNLLLLVVTQKKNLFLFFLRS